MFKPRLQNNYNLIDKYDLIDKYFFSTNNLSTSIKIDIFTLLSNNTSTNLNFLLVKEHSTNQKTVLQNEILTNFKTTLRNIYVYTYLERLLHTQLLNITTNKVEQLDCLCYIIKNSDNTIFYNNDFFNNINSKSIVKFSTTDNIHVSFTNINLKLFLPLHFLP